MVDIQYNKTDLFLLGAGGLARELESWFESSNLSDSYLLKGFIDDDRHALDGFPNDLSIVDVFFEGQIWKGKSVVLGIASCEIKEKALQWLKKHDTELLGFSHNLSIVGKNSQLGSGYVLCPFVVISCNVTIGDCVTINSGSQIGHDACIGDFSSIMANVDIGGGVSIGNSVFIGSNAVILPGVKIADHVRIGAGSVVLKSIKQPGTYFGNPAKKIF